MQYNPDWKPCFGIGDFHDSEDGEVSLAPFAELPYLEVQNIDSYDQEQTRAFRASDEWVQISAEMSTDDRTRIIEDDPLVLPDRVYGFVLRSRKWGRSKSSSVSLGFLMN